MKIYSKTLGNGQNIFWETQYLILTQLYVKKQAHAVWQISEPKLTIKMLYFNLILFIKICQNAHAQMFKLKILIFFAKEKLTGLKMVQVCAANFSRLTN